MTPKNIALLRGINVGGKKKVLMKDLRQLVESLGFYNVSTYIQSGNVFFDGPTDSAASKIGAAIQSRYGFDVPVLVKTKTDFEDIVRAQPYKNAEISAVHLTFLSDIPLEKFLPPPNTDDIFEIIDRTVYIRCKGKYHKSKLSNSFFEKKLKVQATTRSWKTILKLRDIFDQRDL